MVCEGRVRAKVQSGRSPNLNSSKNFREGCRWFRPRWRPGVPTRCGSTLRRLATLYLEIASMAIIVQRENAPGWHYTRPCLASNIQGPENNFLLISPWPMTLSSYVEATCPTATPGERLSDEGVHPKRRLANPRARSADKGDETGRRHPVLRRPFNRRYLGTVRKLVVSDSGLSPLRTVLNCLIIYDKELRRLCIRLFLFTMLAGP